MSLPSDSTPLDLGRAAAARLGQTDWHLEAEQDLASPTDSPVVEERPPAPPPEPRPPRSTRPAPAESPPPPVRILEALLFVGGPPLTAEAAQSAIRGLTPSRFREMVEELNKTYRQQNRPYTVQPRDNGYTLVLRPDFRGVREKLFGGPRAARLAQPALEVLSLVAYRQPITKPDLDALRGADSAGLLRQLVRLGLVAVARRGESEERVVCYGTTPRFLELFGLTSLDDLPRLADSRG